MNLNIYFEYMEMETDLRPCEECGEVIVSKMWAQTTFVDNEPVNIDNPKMFCDACYSVDEIK